MNSIVSRRAQTSTEYLIILAVVIIIALIVVGVLGGIPGIGGGAGDSSHAAYMLSQPVGIMNWVQDSLSTRFTLLNNNKDPIRVTMIEIAGKKCSLSEGDPRLEPGERKPVNCYGVIGLDEGLRYESIINVTYVDLKTSATLVQHSGDAKLVGETLPGSELHTGQQECYDLSNWGDNTPEACASDHEGQDGYQDGTAKSFTTLSDNIIKDDHTGLMWITNESASIDAATSLTYCDTVSNGGYGDWRLPNIVELLTVLGSSTTIDGNPSPNGDSWGSNEIYWSSTQNAGGTRFNTYLYGGTGNQGYFYIDYWTATDKHVVCVRGTTTGITLTDGVDSPKRFVNVGDGTVIDRDTGIVWEQAGSSSTMEWNNSIVHCNNQTTGGYTDWRLPTASEGVTLIDYNCGSGDDGCTDDYKNAAFDWTAGNLYWTGTTAVGFDSAYRVDIASGSVDSDVVMKEDSYSVRCVRDH